MYMDILDTLLEFCDNQIESVNIDERLLKCSVSYAVGCRAAYLDVVCKIKQLKKYVHK